VVVLAVAMKAAVVVLAVIYTIQMRFYLLEP
jgi:hypothetical protein